MKSKTLLSKSKVSQVYAIQGKDGDLYVGHVVGSPVKLRDLLELYYDYRGKAWDIKGVDTYTLALKQAWKDKYQKFDNIDIRHIDDILRDAVDMKRYESTLVNDSTPEPSAAEVGAKLAKDITESLEKAINK